jgi:hypothetical protein
MFVYTSFFTKVFLKALVIWLLGLFLDPILFLDSIVFCDPHTDPLDCKTEEADANSKEEKKLGVLELLLGVVAFYLMLGFMTNYGIPLVNKSLLYLGVVDQAGLDALTNAIFSNRPQNQNPPMSAEEHRDIVQRLLIPPDDTYVEPAQPPK